MNPRLAFLIKLLSALALIVVLALLFPPVMKFVEGAASELRYFWWLVLLLLFACWLIWGLGRKRK
jgi:hypothetical protein